MRFLRFMAAALLLLGAFGCQKLPSEPIDSGGNQPPQEYNGPESGLALNFERGAGQYEFVSDMFIHQGGVTDWATVTVNPDDFSLTTYAGHWYSDMLTRDGVPVLGDYTLAGSTPSNYWMDENRGIFASHMVLVSDADSAWVWQWPSNASQLVDLDIEVLNWSSASELGVVGTPTCYVVHPAMLNHLHDNVYGRSLRLLPGDAKIAVMDMYERVGLGDAVTVRINGTELVAYVDDFTHDNQPTVHLYFRFHVNADGTVQSIGTENRFSYGNTVSVSNSNIDPSATVYLNGSGLTNGEMMPMTYIGNWTWELAGLTTWVGQQDLRVSLEDGTGVFRTVRLNGTELHHLAAVPLDPDPPIQVFRCRPMHDHTVMQGEDNRAADIGVETGG